jgi:hypothetical protein
MMKIRHCCINDVLALSAIIDTDGYTLMMEYPIFLRESKAGRQKIAEIMRYMRGEIRATRTTRIPPTGRMDS